MGFFDLLRRWLWPQQTGPATVQAPEPPLPAKPRRTRRRIKLAPFRRRLNREPRRDPLKRPPIAQDAVPVRPYAFARVCVFGGYLDLARDHDPSRLARFELPSLRTPQEIADWLELPLGQLAWLVHRFDEKARPPDSRHAHYHFRWLEKRAYGQRLIEIPKPLLRQVQDKILRGILNHIPAHPAAHGFIAKRSIRTNAQPHVGQRVVVKLDLENFYGTIGLSRVVSIFRSLGYSREAAVWLGRILTSSLPPEVHQQAVERDGTTYLSRHLPQGAPTSPAVANLSAFSLDLRLAGLARSFHARYTRYADDLTFSGDEAFLKSLRVFLPLAGQIIRSERFKVNRKKRRVIRNNQRQQVTGVMVNERLGVPRVEFDRLKAILVNCIRRGPSTQNHLHHDNFAGCLRGQIAHVTQLNANQGAKLLALYEQIDWRS